MAPTGFKYNYRGLNPAPLGRKKRGCGFIGFVIVVLLIAALCVIGYQVWKGLKSDKPASKPKPGVPDSVSSVKPPALPVNNTVKPVPTDTSSIDPEKMVKYREIIKEAAGSLAKKNYIKASKLASEITGSKLSENCPEWVEAANILSEANTAIFQSDMPYPGKKELYIVKRGDYLDKIARKFNTSTAAIQKSNNMGPNDINIRTGQTLCIYKGNWKIKVDKSLHRLYLYDGGKLFKMYSIGIGRQGRTPTGTFKIVSMIEKPAWDSPKGKIPYGDKENVLGTRWMQLKPTGDTNPNLKGYGIHGTWQPESIGHSMSNGCIRMKNRDVEELYSIVPYGTPVTIEN